MTRSRHTAVSPSKWNQRRRRLGHTFTSYYFVLKTCFANFWNLINIWNPAIFNMIRWDDGSTAMEQSSRCVWWSNVYFDRLGIIQWESGSVILIKGISNCSLQNSIFFTQLLAKFPFKIILNFYFLFICYFFYKLKK